MAEADTLTYYNKLAAVRASQPIAPAAAFAVRQCDGFISGDAQYTYRCPAAWLEYTGAPTVSNAQLVFARDYFNWVKGYLSLAAQNKPTSSSSAEFRVVWALDCWAHVNFALFALPLPWSDIFSEGVGGVPELDLDAVILSAGPASITGETAAAAAWSAEKSKIASSSSVKTIRDAAAASRLNPSPFSELVLRWIRAPGSRSPYFQKPNPIWPLVLAAIQPWSSAWERNWLQSRGNKDSGDLARWRNDPVLIRAVLQWRLWSVQDYGFVGYSDGFIDPTFWPAGMGRANAVAPLSAYINHVKGEKTSPSVTFNGSQAYPNLAFGLESVSSHMQRIMMADFDTVLAAHLTMWLSQSSPRVNLDGSLRTNPDGTFMRQPVTSTDYKDYFKGLRKAITDRMRLALANPVLACPPNDSQCIAAAKQGAKVNAAISTSPLGPVQNWMQRVSDKLVELLGAAVGGGYEPFFVLRNPFSRTFTAQGYRLIADGSSADVFFRISLAIENYKALLPQLFFARTAQAARVQRGNCKVHWTRSSTACEICEGQTRPPCAADVVGLPAYVDPATVAHQEHACLVMMDAWIRANPNIRLSDADQQRYMSLCLSATRGEMSSIMMLVKWDQYLKSRKGGLLATLVNGFMRASNPLR